MLDYRSTVAASICFGALLVGCTDPDQPTDLRKDGPPNITAVTVMSDLETAADPNPAGIGRIVETATFCRVNDEKRPGLVGLPDIRVIQVCPELVSKPSDDDGVAEAAPPTWFVRVVFDKLLDSSIEDLVPQLDTTGKPTGVTIGTLKNTQPVTLTCNGVNVPYDGYYVPNGNRSSWPLGPALFVQPLSSTSVPTGASCTVSVKDNVHNKSGQSVPTGQRDFNFKLAPMALRFSSPAPEDSTDGSLLLDPNTPVDFFFTAALKVAAGVTTLDPTQVKIFSGPNLNVGASNLDGDADPAVCNGGGAAVDPTTIRALARGTAATTTALVLRLDVEGGAAPLDTRWAPNTTYSITFTPNAKVTPAQGGPDGTFPADYKLCFHTSAPPA
jgi:hypothetical protein